MLTLRKIANEVQRVAMEHPNHCYLSQFSTPTYVHQALDNGRLVGGCLLGVALGNLGVDLEKLFYGYNSVLIHKLLPLLLDLKSDPEPTLMSVLCQAQRLQDDGISWGEVIYRSGLGDSRRSWEEQARLAGVMIKFTPPLVPMAFPKGFFTFDKPKIVAKDEKVPEMAGI